MAEKRRVYLVQETVRAEDGGYIVCIAEENSPGYWRTDWNWGTDKEIIDDLLIKKNALLLEMPFQTAEERKEVEKEVFLITLSSMGDRYG